MANQDFSFEESANSLYQEALDLFQSCQQLNVEPMYYKTWD